MLEIAIGTKCKIVDKDHTKGLVDILRKSLRLETRV